MKRLLTGLVLGMALVLALGATAFRERFGQLAVGILRVEQGISYYAGSTIVAVDDVALTSPTVTFDVAGKTFINLSTDVSQTGVVPTGGTLNQVIIVRGSSDTKTCRMDDGTSTMLTGNLTLGVNDNVILRCVDADGDEWEEIGGANN